MPPSLGERIIFSAIVCGILAIPVILMGGGIYETRRTSRIAAVASRLGLNFYHPHRMGLDLRPSDPQLLAALRGAKAAFGNLQIKNVMRAGLDASELAVFDLVCQVDKSWSAKTVAILMFSDFELPEFLLQPNNILVQLNNVTAGDVIRITHINGFDQKYVVRARCEDRVREFFDERITDFFTSHPGLKIQSLGNRLVIWTKRKRLSPSATEEFLKQLIELNEVVCRPTHPNLRHGWHTSDALCREMKSSLSVA